MILTPSSDASQRTKNRIREHGPEFNVRRVSREMLCDMSGWCVLVDTPDGWLGWLPMGEINEKLQLTNT